MRAAWLEPHAEFQGVGAHELNRRYDPIDEGEHDGSIAAVPQLMPALFAARSFLAAATVTPRFDGADISHFQHEAGPVQWMPLRQAPSTWFATKLTQSTRYLDPTAARSRAASFACGMVHRGLYHWLSSTTDPEQQAAWFLAKAGVLGVGEFAMLDDEEAGVTVSKSLGWLEAVERVTRRPCAVYTGAYVAGGTIWQSTAIRESRFGPRPMILAAYTTEARARALPGVKSYPWSSWQYSSNGPVPGITGRCDMNRVDDVAVYDRACGLTVVHHPPIEVDPTPTPGPSGPIEEDALYYIVDVPERGLSAGVKVGFANNVPTHTIHAFNTMDERKVWADAGLNALEKSGAEFDELVSAAATSLD
jgi:GH25 family lysozyme M1 (1,4-beta-N-acetylmuramidase)